MTIQRGYTTYQNKLKIASNTKAILPKIVSKKGTTSRGNSSATIPFGNPKTTVMPSLGFNARFEKNCVPSLVLSLVLSEVPPPAPSVPQLDSSFVPYDPTKHRVCTDV